MKLNACLELARKCGLETYREALSNIGIHAGMLFLYEEINAEMIELEREFLHSGADLDDYIPEA